MPDIELRPRQVGSEGQERNRRLVRLPLAHEALDATSGCGSLTALDAAHEGKTWPAWAPSRLPSLIFFRGGCAVLSPGRTRTRGHHASGGPTGRGEGECV